MRLHPDIIHPKTINRFKTLEEDLNKIWGDKLDFSESIHSGMNKKLWYVCNTHKKKYEAIPNSLLSGVGCPDCGRVKVNKANKDRSKKCAEEFATKAEKKHPNKYDYTMVWYRDSVTEVMIWCKTHKYFFWMTPNGSLRGNGCKTCGYELLSTKNSAGAKENFPARAEAIHPNKNYYHLVEYKGVDHKVTLWCVGCDVPYEITPQSSLSGSGHSNCSGGGGFKPNLPAILYYIRVETRNRVCWKIGITNLTVKERFSRSDLELITIINEVHYENGQDAWDAELRIKREHKEFQYVGDPLLNRGGNTELFTKDILGIDQLDQPQKEDL